MFDHREPDPDDKVEARVIGWGTQSGTSAPDRRPSGAQAAPKRSACAPPEDRAPADGACPRPSNGAGRLPAAIALRRRVLCLPTKYRWVWREPPAPWQDRLPLCLQAALWRSLALQAAGIHPVGRHSTARAESGARLPRRLPDIYRVALAPRIGVQSVGRFTSSDTVGDLRNDTSGPAVITSLVFGRAPRIVF